MFLCGLKPAAFAAALLLLMGAEAVADDDSQPAEDSDAVHRLLVERVEVLTQIVDLETEGYRQGVTPLELVLDSRIELTSARIGIARTADERVALHEALVDQLRELEGITQLKVDAAATSPVDALKVKAMRLLAEADLARLRGDQE